METTNLDDIKKQIKSKKKNIAKRAKKAIRNLECQDLQCESSLVENCISDIEQLRQYINTKKLKYGT